MPRWDVRFIGLVLVPSLALGLVLAVEPTAHACSGCADRSRVAPSSGTALPANALGIAWNPSSSVPEGELPVLYDVDSGQPLAVETLDVWPLVFVYPMDGAVPGQSYRFELPADDCSSTGATVRLEATEPVALPEVSLGTLAAEDATLGDVPVPADLSCTEDVEGVRVDIDLQLSPELQPFSDALMYETYVDGERWSHDPAYYHEFVPGSSWNGQRGSDRLVELCFDGVGGSPEPRTVQMVARVAGAPEIAYESNTVEVVLDCSMVPATGETDGATGADGSSGTDDGTSGADAGATDGDDGGCACNVDGRPTTPGLLLAMLAFLGLASRRRTLQSSSLATL
jgi:MYXO-CTERM domain-containing protein